MPRPKKKQNNSRSRGRSKPESEAQSPESKTPKAPPLSTPQEACRRAMDSIVVSLPDVIGAQIKKANEGSHQHAKFLCEFAGLSGALVSPAAAEDDSLARLLLDKLQIGEEDIPSRFATLPGTPQP